MIPGIQEVNFPQYATLSNATATFVDMGERTISTDVKIDGDVVPNFEGWELTFRGERFVLNVKDPQAVKDNSSIRSTVSLIFHSWPVLQLKRFFMFTVQTTATGQVTADKYNASVMLSLTDFCALMNQVLTYYFHGKIYIDLATGVTSEAALIEINYAYIWDVIQKIFETYSVKWRIEYVSNTDSYAIRVGYDDAVIDDHDFEYGFEGGLMRFERQVQDEDIRNILLGRGGTQNVPYRYFKDTDPQNPDWAADPDYVPELANVYFDRIRDANFRRYIQGWRTNPLGALGAVDTYDTTRAQTDWAYEKGHTDTVFDPVEYVKDDESILKYGERWGHLEDNDEIYPTIQGVVVNGVRVDTVLGVSPILTDDISGAASAAASIVDIEGVMTQTDSVAPGLSTKEIRGTSFTVPAGRVANLMDNGFFLRSLSAQRAQQVRMTVGTENSYIKVYKESNGQEVPRDGLQPGTYYYVITVSIANLNQETVNDVTYGVNGLYLMTSDGATGEWSPTFDIYVCNLFNTTQGANESDEDYAIRVWRPILGDHLGNEAKVIFSDGFMSISEDYEFTIASYPKPDRTATLGTVTSEWKITLNKCDAEFDATGLYIPNATTGGKPIAGDHFFFTGIDMPHFYVTEAEKRLTAFKEEALPDNAETNPTWVVSLDKIRIDQQYNRQQERLINKIDAGVGFRVYDRRFSGGQVLSLTASSATFTWQDGTVILPEVEVVLTERTMVVKSSYNTLQSDVNTIKRTYATVDEAAATSREQAKQLYLGKSGEKQVSMSPTRFASIIASENFEQGEFGGKGWGFYEDNSDLYQDKDGVDEDLIPKQSVLEVDRLVVRREMMLNRLTVNQTAYFGGRQIISAAAVECTQVVVNSGNYVCYFDQKQGSVKNLFQLNDIALSQTFDGGGNEVRYYRRLVIAVGLDYITLSGSVVDGAGIPKAGDIIVQYGNTADTGRQYAIVRDVIGGGREFMMSNLNSVSATGDEYFYAGIKAIEGPAGTSGLAPAPYFFTGNQDSHIKFNSRKQKTYIKGGLVLSPAGTEFPVPCYRGDYEQNATYYPGDLVVYNGESWLHQGDTAITGVAPGTGSSWHKYAAKGASAYRLDLSNEFSTVNADSSGAIVPGAVLPSCRAQLYEGTSVLAGTVYSVATPQAAAATGVSINASTGELQFSNSFAFTGDTLEVSVTANNTAKGVAMTAIMTVSKIHPGSDGTPATSYWIVLDTDKVSVDPNVTPLVPNPPTVAPTAMMQVGGNAPQAATGCTLEYFYDNETAQTISSGTALSIALMNGDTVRKTLHFNLKKGSTVVDQESVPILYDGEKGDDGADGDYADFSFAYSPNLSSSQSDGCPTDSGTDGSSGTRITSWSDTPPSRTAASAYWYLWMKVTQMHYEPDSASADANGYVATGTSYARIGGDDSVSADLSNEMDGLGIGSDGVLNTPITEANALQTTLSMYKGPRKLAVTNISVNQSEVPTGISYSTSIVNGTGLVKFWAPNAATTPVPLDGRFPITITGTCAEGQRSLVYILAGIKDGADGTTYILVPSVSSVKKTAATPPQYSDEYVTCRATDASGHDLLSGTYSIYYRLDGGSPQLYTAGISTAAFSTKLTFLLFLEAPNASYSNFVDIETIPMLSDGQGLQGATGKIPRGVTVYSQTGNYQGYNDNGEGDIYVDNVVYPDPQLVENPNEDCSFFQCITKVGATSTADPANNPTCWEEMNKFSSVAVKAMYAERLLVGEINANKLNSDPQGGGPRTTIAGENIAVFNGPTSQFFGVKPSLSPSEGGGTQPTTYSAAASSASGSAGSVLTRTLVSGISVSGNNKVAISAIDLRISFEPDQTEGLPRPCGISCYLENSNGVRIPLSGDYRGTNYTGARQTIAAQTISLSDGTYALKAEFWANDDTAVQQPAYIAVTGALLSAISITVTPLSSDNGTYAAADGFRAVFSDSTHLAQGFEVTPASGAKIIRDGDDFNAVGSDELTTIRIIRPGSDYPSDAAMQEGCLYIKLSQAVV